MATLANPRLYIKSEGRHKTTHSPISTTTISPNCPISSKMPTFTITPAETPKDLTETTTLFKSYGQALNIDLTFQDFATELATLLGKYSPPTGALLLARTTTSAAVGCVALRPLLPPLGVCEMKRLYVSPSARGMGVGCALAEAVVLEARRWGYAAVRLDTLPEMGAAREVYARLGFVEVEAYYETPVEGTVFLELRL